MVFQDYLIGFNLDFVLKSIFAILLGMILGWERGKAGKTAGIGTYALITLGAMVFTFASINGFFSEDVRDPARIAAQIVTGIGFIGAGVIWKNKDHVEGVTTAAGLWVAAGIGLLIGINMVLSAIFITLVALITLIIRSKIEIRRYGEKNPHPIKQER